MILRFSFGRRLHRQAPPSPRIVLSESDRQLKEHFPMIAHDMIDLEPSRRALMEQLGRDRAALDASLTVDPHAYAEQTRLLAAIHSHVRVLDMSSGRTAARTLPPLPSVQSLGRTLRAAGPGLSEPDDPHGAMAAIGEAIGSGA